MFIQSDEEEGDDMILDTKVTDFAHFINVLGEAINKREFNSSNFGHENIKHDRKCIFIIKEEVPSCFKTKIG